MYYDEAGRYFGRGAEGAAEYVGKHGAPQPFALPSQIDCQPSENDRRDGTWHVPPHGAGNILGQDLPHAEGKIPDDLL